MPNTNRNHRFYVNPITGRVIKSTGKVHKRLKTDNIVADKDRCLYNVKSAKRCLERIFSLYPDEIYPPSSLINIPKTYKNGKARSFIVNNYYVIAIVMKNGEIKKLKTPVRAEVKKIPVVKDPINAIPRLLETSGTVSNEIQKDVEHQLEHDRLLGYPESTTLIYNPAHNDFVPVNRETTHKEDIEIINSINETIVPQTLPPIVKRGKVAAVITDNDDIVGIVDINNKVSKLSEAVPIRAPSTPTQKTKTPFAFIEKNKRNYSKTDFILMGQQSKQILSDGKIIENVKANTPTNTPIRTPTNTPIEPAQETPAKGESSRSEISLQTESGSEIESVSSISSTPIEGKSGAFSTGSEMASQTESESSISSTPIENESSARMTGSEIASQTESGSELESESSISGTSSESEPESILSKQSKTSIVELPDELKQPTDIDGIPQIKAGDLANTFIDKTPLSTDETKRILDELRCIDGEQFDVNQKRCLPCSHYNLVWDPLYKMCKIAIKLPSDDIIIVDDNDEIIGYM